MWYVVSVEWEELLGLKIWDPEKLVSIHLSSDLVSIQSHVGLL